MPTVRPGRTPKHPGQQFVFCANAVLGSCNWLIPAEPGGPVYCRACRHNEMIPDLTDPQRLTQWQTIERAKHRLIYALLRFGLPLETRAENPAHGLSFRFLADELGARAGDDRPPERDHHPLPRRG